MSWRSRPTLLLSPKTTSNNNNNHGVVLHPPTAAHPIRKLCSADLRTSRSYAILLKTSPTTNIHPSPPQFLLGLITIVPWAALILFDAALYLYRMILWELPWIGGRARGERRPRAPSLNERPDGQRRAFGLRGVEEINSGEGEGEDDGDGGAGRSRGASVNKFSGTEKENVAPVSGGWAHINAEGDVKRRAGRSEHS